MRSKEDRGSGGAASGGDWEEARRLLVEGRPVRIGGTIVRFFPSYREVARSMDTNVSKVARWAASEKILDARQQRLATDRIEVYPQVPITTETLVEETLRLVNASMSTSIGRLSERKLVTILKIVAILLGLTEARLGLAKEIERLRASLLKRRVS